MSQDTFQDKAPPMKEPEEFLKEEVKSARNGIAVFLIIAFAFCRILQVFSRRPGTSGGLIILASAFSLVPFFIFYEQRVKETGQPDGIGPGAFGCAFVIVFAVDVFYALLRVRRKQHTPTRALGCGKLDWAFPYLPPALVGLISDITLCASMLWLCNLFRMPIHVEYFSIITAWIVITHAVMGIQYWWFAGRIRQTRKRATYYHKQVKEW